MFLAAAVSTWIVLTISYRFFNDFPLSKCIIYFPIVFNFHGPWSKQVGMCDPSIRCGEWVDELKLM